MAEEWRSLSEDARAQYVKLAEKDKERYNKELIAY